MGRATIFFARPLLIGLLYNLKHVYFLLIFFLPYSYFKPDSKQALFARPLSIGPLLYFHSSLAILMILLLAGRHCILILNFYRQTKFGLQTNRHSFMKLPIFRDSHGAPTDLLDDQKYYVTDLGPQLTSLMIQKRYVTNKRPQPTSFDPKPVCDQQRDPTDLR